MPSVQVWNRLLKSKVKSASTKISSSSHQNLDCPLLQLPVKIILLVADHLSIVDQLILSETCRPLWDTLRRRCGPPSTLSRQQYLEYLTVNTRGDLGRWVCHHCARTHRVNTRDTPRAPHHTRCPKVWRAVRLCGESLQFRPEHRHIQLALKNNRICGTNKKNEKCLDLLTNPYRAPFSTGSSRVDALTAEYSAYPRIAGGRYLLLSVWRYRQSREPVSEQTMGTLKLCWHQALEFECLFSELGFEVGEGNLRATGYDPLWRKRALRRAFKHAKELPGIEVRGACTLCPVDFSVNFTPQETVVCAWHDFGPEGTPLDLAWMVHVESPNITKLKLGHQEATIRGLYENGGRGRDGQVLHQTKAWSMSQLANVDSVCLDPHPWPISPNTPPTCSLCRRPRGRGEDTSGWEVSNGEGPALELAAMASSTRFLGTGIVPECRHLIRPKYTSPS